MQLERDERSELGHGEPGERKWERDRDRGGDRQFGNDEPDGDGDNCWTDLQRDAGGGAGAVQLRDFADGGLACGRW